MADEHKNINDVVSRVAPQMRFDLRGRYWSIEEFDQMLHERLQRQGLLARVSKQGNDGFDHGFYKCSEAVTEALKLDVIQGMQNLYLGLPGSDLPEEAEKDIKLRATVLDKARNFLNMAIGQTQIPSSRFMDLAISYFLYKGRIGRFVPEKSAEIYARDLAAELSEEFNVKRDDGLAAILRMSEDSGGKYILH